MSKIIVALDGISESVALEFAQLLSGEVWGFKVNDLLVQHGVEIIKKLKPYGKVFADPKVHDIPKTIANSVKHFAEAGADLITVHGSAGREGLKAAAKNRGHSSILAITALTSLTERDTDEIYGLSPQAVVEKFARIAVECDLQGVVCSPQELQYLSSYSSLIKVTPGVRPSDYSSSGYGVKDDQSRVATPESAVSQGASLLVIGRPIMESSHPLEKVRHINESINT